MNNTRGLSAFSRKLIEPDDNFWRRNDELNNSTALTISSEDIDAEFLKLFEHGKREVFEDGMETPFSRELLSKIIKYDSLALDSITRLILSGTISTEVAAETMRWLGLMESSVAREKRLWLLENQLRASSERIRDGALLGLSFMDDYSAISYLEDAIKAEQIPELRDDMEQVLEQLKDTQESSL